MNEKSYLGSSARGLTEEFRIPHPCGFIAGKTWGDCNNKPVLCLHGWLDNCNTFDRLIPLLPRNYFYVVVDFLGHGLSSHLPDGGWYMALEDITTVKRVMNYFEWTEDVIVISHSWGGAVASEFAAIYPEMLDKLILLDVGGVVYAPDTKYLDGRIYRRNIDAHLRHEGDDHPPSKQYTYEEAKKRMQVSDSSYTLYKLTLTDDAAHVLLERSLKQEQSGLFTFRRDFKLRIMNYPVTSFEKALSMFNNITCDVHVIRGLRSALSLAVPKEENKLWRKTTKDNLFLHDVDGDHHAHLNQPNNVAPIIIKILQGLPLNQEALSSKL